MADENINFQLIASMYETAIDANKWPEVLDQLAPVVGAESSALLLVSTNNNYDYSISAMSSHIPDAMKMTYIQDYSSYEQDHFGRVASSVAGTVVNEREQFADKSVFDSRPDVVFLRDNLGVHERFAMRLNNEPSWLECITFQFATGRNNIQQDELARLLQFFPHLSKITQITRTFSMLKARYMAVLSVLDRVSMAYAIVLSSGEVICLNESAKKTFAKDDGLKLTADKKVRTTDSAIDAEIQETVNLVSDTVLGIESNSGKLITVPRLSNVEPFLIEVSPLRDSTRELDDFINGALITIIDTEEQADISTNGLKELYQLTDAEFEVADLIVKGLSNNAIADERGVSSETIKSQVQSIFIKTNAANRTALIRQVLSINLPII